MDIETKPEPAILVRGVSKQYGSDRKVLDNLNMTVIKGTIYGLLGASGCGKTTLLGAILGSKKIQNGEISILGRAPGIVPVKSIGYMPQDIALVGEFTIKEVLQHQAWIFGMSDKDIKKRLKFVKELLDLPPLDKQIRKLSGGQQRRVSLAVVLIQDPELLILDEPTVGLDPILRQNLWDYFIKITKEDKKTVVITTHYIEEAKQADMVGMLRHGKIIAEGNPQSLIDQFNSSSLENLFTTLSLLQTERGPNFVNPQPQNELISKCEETKIFNQRAPTKSIKEKIFFTNRGHMKALLSKDYIRYVRQPTFLSVAMLLPIIQVCVIYLAVGRIPDDLKIGIVNQELGEYRSCEDYANDNNIVGGYRNDTNGTCLYNSLGCKFLEQIRSVIPNQIYFESIEEALVLVKKAEIHHVLFFSYNYTREFTAYFNAGIMQTTSHGPKQFNFHKIIVHRDEVDYALGLYVEKELYNAYQKFAENLAKDCHSNEHAVKAPIVFHKAIYGKFDMTFSEFFTPSVLTIFLAYLAVALPLLAIICDKREGVWERTIMSGIKPSEILLSHIIITSFISLLQTLETLLFAKYVFVLECQGNIIHYVLLVYLQALLGISIGVCLSVISSNETEAIYGAMSVAWPILMLTGILWPLESLPTFLRHISHALPFTIALQSLNNIMFRGWSISNFNVYKGFLATSGYLCVFTLLSIFLLKFEKK